MKVLVVFDFPDISDPNGERADYTIAILEDELYDVLEPLGYTWNIEDAFV